jgi:hypothetical protein
VDTDVCPQIWFSGSNKSAVSVVFRVSRLSADLVEANFTFILKVEALDTECIMGSTLMGGLAILSTCTKHPTVGPD